MQVCMHIKIFGLQRNIPFSSICHVCFANPETWHGREMQRAFHWLMNSTALSHPGPRLLAFAPFYSCSQGQRSGSPDLTLELEKKVDVTAHIKWEFPSIFQSKFPKYTTNTRKCGSQVSITHPCLTLMCKALHTLDQGLSVNIRWICSPQQLHEADLPSATHRGQVTSPKSQLVESQDKVPKLVFWPALSSTPWWLTHGWQMLCSLLKEVGDIQETSSNLVRMYHHGRKAPCSS